jgi:hypothetical protein
MKIIFSFVTLIISCFILIYVISTDKAKSYAGSEVKRTLIEYSDIYDQALYKSFYSIEELRPYSIIQLDKIADLYQNDWITPDNIVPKLDESDKIFMIDKISELIESRVSTQYRKNILEMIKHWCMNYSQLSFISDKLGIHDHDVFNALFNIDATREIMRQYVEKKSPVEDNFSVEGKSKAYYSAINYISTLDFNEELSYFSEVYKYLAQTYNNKN